MMSPIQTWAIKKGPDAIAKTVDVLKGIVNAFLE
jgi:hypothetical protein